MLLACLCATALFWRLSSHHTEFEPSVPNSSPPTPAATVRSTNPDDRKLAVQLPTPFPDPDKPLPVWVNTAPEVVDLARAPDWIVRRSYYEDEEEMIFPRREPVWLFQENRRHVVPASPYQSGDCVISEQYLRLENGVSEIMLESLGNWYRYQIEVVSLTSLMDMETDPSKFKIYIATTEYKPPEWRERILKQTVTKLGVKAGQIELTVPPERGSDADTWVVGTSDSLRGDP